MLEDSDALYSVKAADHVDILRKDVGDMVTLEYLESAINDVYTVTGVE